MTCVCICIGHWTGRCVFVVGIALWNRWETAIWFCVFVSLYIYIYTPVKQTESHFWIVSTTTTRVWVWGGGGGGGSLRAIIDDKKNDNELRQVFDYAIQNSKSSVTLLDTAELYGLGRSESLIGDFSKSYTESQVQVATKFAPFPWRTKAQDVVTACEKSLARLDRPAIDLYQIHFPNAYANAEYWDGLAMAYDKGLVKAVGVSNYGIDATRACAKALEERGLKLATNQIQLSLLYRWPLENGLLQCCQDLGVQVLSYSPLALGMLTGKYTADNKPVGPRKAIFEKLQTTPDYANLLDAMDQVGNSSSGGSSSKAQVALNWARAKGTVPIPGARTVSQVKSNYKALDWTLSKDEVEFLDQAASKVTTFLQPDAGPIPKKDKDTGLIMFDS